MTKKTKTKEDTFARSGAEENELKSSFKAAGTESSQHNYTKLRQNFSDEIRYFMKEIRAEIEWLDEHCQAEIGQCKSDEGLFKLGRLRNFLHKTREDLRSHSYRVSKSDIIVDILNEDPDDLM